MLEKMGKGVQIAEEQRDKRKHHGFVPDLFYGKAPFKALFPWPQASGDAERQLREAMVGDVLRSYLTSLDVGQMERSRSMLMEDIEYLSREGMFALKIPQTPWGGKELGQAGYNHIMSLAASRSSAVWILLSADNTIGAKFPVLKYGTPEQQKRYLPDLTQWPSGFCFTEKNVGSDPASMEAYALRKRDAGGNVVGYEIVGQKQYTTNAAFDDTTALARYFATVTKIVDRPDEVANSKCFGMFIVPTNTGKTVVVGPRNYFSGMRGIHNANPKFNNVYVSVDQRIGKEGEGFRIALEALNTGRIAIAAGAAAQAKQAFLAMRWRADRRHQWGKAIGDHELIGSGMLANAAAQIFAMEALVEYAGSLVDRGEDARLVAGLTKVFTTERGWQVIDNMMQLFGGSGYESFETLSRREEAAPVERMWRDARPNRIFEGSTQILSQWCMREGFAELIKQGETLLGSGSVVARTGMRASLALDYARLFVPGALYANAHIPSAAQEHLRFVERNARKFVRTFMMKANAHKAALSEMQLTLERFFWIMAELAAMSASCAHAAHIAPNVGDEAWQLCDAYCQSARLRIRQLFWELAHNNDEAFRHVAGGVRAKRYRFLESHIIPLVDLDRD
ncbi:MAG: acyl-CoA dehydrogenase family protein [bacterium]|nr:acyl-CoA dehydrogenase family protein [bacterium]